LQVDPDNTELQSLRSELEELISLTEQSIAELRPALATPASPRKPKSNRQSHTPPPPAKEKWSKENHPAYQAGYRKPVESAAPREEEPQPPQAPPASYSVNDTVLARWVSGDNSFYPARITSITGSSTNPMYIVSFKSYSTIETLTAKDIKPFSNNNNDSRKRKADGISGSSTPKPHSGTPTPAQSSVISAAADINPSLASQARKESTVPGDGAARPSKSARKVKANKELEAGKSKWQEFTTKNKYGKAAKKESMFRTPEGVKARGACPSIFL
jgi:survival-of-motor-neuron-related-splicing factor 30